ncbi:MAG: hypothetical protein V1860_00270 [bacterium]
MKKRDYSIIGLEILFTVGCVGFFLRKFSWHILIRFWAGAFTPAVIFWMAALFLTAAWQRIKNWESRKIVFITSVSSSLILSLVSFVLALYIKSMHADPNKTWLIVFIFIMLVTVVDIFLVLCFMVYYGGEKERKDLCIEEDGREEKEIGQLIYNAKIFIGDAECGEAEGGEGIAFLISIFADNNNNNYYSIIILGGDNDRFVLKKVISTLKIYDRDITKVIFTVGGDYKICVNDVAGMLRVIELFCSKGYGKLEFQMCEKGGMSSVFIFWNEGRICFNKSAYLVNSGSILSVATD